MQDMRPEHHILSEEITSAFQRCLQEHAGPANCIQNLIQDGLRLKAERFVTLNAYAAEKIKAKQLLVAPINHPEFLHFFWLLNLENSLVECYLDVLLDPTIAKHFPQTKFLKAYSEAAAVFMGRAVHLPIKPALSGYEKFWEPYYDFMVGAITAEDLAIKARDSFERRNSQRRMIDWLNLDGDGRKPVKWDLRYESIRKKCITMRGSNDAGASLVPISPQ